MKNLGDNLLDGLGSFHTNQAFVQTTVEKSEVIGVQSKLVQDSSVQAADMEFIIHSPAAQFISRTNGHTAFDSSSSHPHGKAVGVVIPPGTLLVLGSGLAAKFTPPRQPGSHPIVRVVLNPSAIRQSVYQYFPHGARGF